MSSVSPTFPLAIAFSEHRAIARGSLDQLALSVRDWIASHPHSSVLVFDAQTGAVIDLDLRGSDDEIHSRLPTSPSGPSTGMPSITPMADADQNVNRGRGRPRLGVVAREVTLLPRHWEWLAGRPGGASVTLRKLVESARRSDAGVEQRRRAQDATYRFMSALGGDLPGFEEASRALFASDMAGFQAQLQSWPRDVREHLIGLAAPLSESS